MNRGNIQNNHRKHGKNGIKRTKTHGLEEKQMELVKLLVADCETTGDIHAKLKKLFAGTIEQILEAEMDEHLGYEKSSIEGKNSENGQNGYGKKTITGDYGECEIAVSARGKKIKRGNPIYTGSLSAYIIESRLDTKSQFRHVTLQCTTIFFDARYKIFASCHHWLMTACFFSILRNWRFKPSII